ncbi:MAG TPA: DUF962 domain-containing protein [Myxococcota bacterium]
MLDAVLSLVTDKKKRDVASMALGMGSLLVGNKLGGLALFAKGAIGLEQHWRQAHPEFRGSLVDRWNAATSFYEATHKNDVNRKLHIVGIPFIVGGAAGLLLFVPFGPRWWLSWSAFTGGWVLNFIGHGVYEKKAPAFADDPLSFLAGPVWDLQQVFGTKSKSPRSVQTPWGEMVINVDPIEPAEA